MRRARIWAVMAVVAGGLGWAAACQDGSGPGGPSASKREARSDIMRGIVASKQPMPAPEKLDAQRGQLNEAAAPPPAPAPPDTQVSADSAPPPEDHRPEPLEGTVEQVGRGALVVRDGQGQARSVPVDGTTRFVREGKVVDRRAVREGSEVRVFYDAQRGPQVADEVELRVASKPNK